MPLLSMEGSINLCHPFTALILSQTRDHSPRITKARSAFLSSSPRTCISNSIVCSISFSQYQFISDTNGNDQHHYKSQDTDKYDD